MNVIAPVRPKQQLKITVEERARRQEAVDYARGSVRLEGFVVPPFAEETYSRFVDGEITEEQLTAIIVAHYKP